MSIGLDVGSSQIRCLRLHGEQTVGSSSRALFAVLPDASEYRALLEAGHIPFAICDGALALIGDNAAAYSSLFHVRPQALLPHGRLPTNDPVARQCLAALVEALLGEPNQPGEMCCVTLPGGEMFQSLATNNELEFLTRLIRLRGFTPQVLPATMAAVLAQLVSRSFTGIGLSFGAATSELVLTHRGIQVAIEVSPRGGDWMDELIAEHFEYALCDAEGASFLNLDQARAHREGLTSIFATPGDSGAQFLADVHQDLVYELIRSAAEKFSQQPRTIDVPQPLTVIVVGRVARAPGFRDLLEKAFETARFPLEIGNIQFATDDNFTVARGCLINSQLETEVRSAKPRAA
ncbi:MAG: hypothetical protein NT013_00955 [Planctomycetia bacterium]|nr:hypothetical protein [Planctomycetia bacterium]